MPGPSSADFAMPWLGRASKALVIVSITAGFVFAHHGASAFDPSKEVTLDGTISGFVFSNPHVQVFFEVMSGSGEKQTWQGELTAPNKLIRAGWSKRTLKPGDRVTITGFQAWKDQHAIWVRKIIGPGGQPLPLAGE